jgi:hypothetical protein
MIAWQPSENLVAVHRFKEFIAPESAICVGVHDWWDVLRERLALSVGCIER